MHKHSVGPLWSGIIGIVSLPQTGIFKMYVRYLTSCSSHAGSVTQVYDELDNGTGTNMMHI